MSEAFCQQAGFERVIKKVVNNTIINDIITKKNFFNKLKSVRNTRNLSKQRYSGQNNHTGIIYHLLFS